MCKEKRGYNAVIYGCRSVADKTCVFQPETHKIQANSTILHPDKTAIPQTRQKPNFLET
jgi:hypothetical protein